MARLVLFMFLFSLLTSSHSGQVLKTGFYSESCPEAEEIIKEAVRAALPSNTLLAAKLLRLSFHDCFVRGCDGSVLLDGAGSEKTAPENLSLKGFEFLDQVKSELELKCPGTVSCTDALLLAARDAVSIPFGQDLWEVPTGRRDGMTSQAEEVSVNLPLQSDDFEALRVKFGRNNLSVEDLVALSGAHTIGLAHCSSFADRLYNFSGSGGVDPALDLVYADFLKARCPINAPQPENITEMDPTGPAQFDSGYFQIVREHKGLFHSDAALLTDQTAAATVERFIDQQQFLAEFGKSITKMNAVGVLTGMSGEVRKNCRHRYSSFS